MIDDIARLESGKFVRFGESQADQTLVSDRCDRTVDQSAADLRFQKLCRRQMRVFRKLAAHWQAFEHRRAPRVSAKQPITMIDRGLAISCVACHQFVQMHLRDERDDQIVRTPEEGNSYSIRVRLCTRDDAFDAAAVISRKLGFRLLIDKRIQRKMPDVRERIHLIVPRHQFTHSMVFELHPGCRRG